MATAAAPTAIDLRHAQQLQMQQQQPSHVGHHGDDTNRTTYSATPSEVAAADSFSLRLSARGFGSGLGGAESEDALGVAKDSRYHAASLHSPPLGATLEQQRAARAAAAAVAVSPGAAPGATSPGFAPRSSPVGFAHLASRGGASLHDDYAVLMDVGSLDSLMPFPAATTTLPAIHQPHQQNQVQQRKLPLATGAMAAAPGSAAAGQGMGAGFLSNGEARTNADPRNFFAMHPSQASPSQSQPHSSRTSRSMLGSHTDLHSSGGASAAAGTGVSGSSSTASLASFGVGAHTASTAEGDLRRDFRRAQEEKDERAQYDQIRGGVMSQFAGEPSSPANANPPGGALATVKHLMLGSGPPGHASAALAASAAAVAAVRPGVKPYVRYAPKYNLPYGDAPRQNPPPPTAAQLAAESKAHEMESAVIASVSASPADSTAAAAGSPQGDGLAQIRSTTLFNLSGALNTHVGIQLNASVFRNHQQNLPENNAAAGANAGRKPGSSAGRPGSSAGRAWRDSSAQASTMATAAGRPVSAAATAAVSGDATQAAGEDGADGGTFLTGVNLTTEAQAPASARGDLQLVVSDTAAAAAARKEQQQIVTPEDLRAFSALSSVEDAAQWLPRLLRPTRQSIEATEAAARAAAQLRTTVRQRHAHQRPLLPALPLLSIPARVNLPELMDLALDSLAYIPGSHLPGQYAGQAAALSSAKLQAFRGYWLSAPSRAIMHDAYYFVLLYFFKPLPELETEMGNTAAAESEKEEARAASAGKGGATTRRKAAAGSSSDDEDKPASARRSHSGGGGQGGAPVTLGLNSKSSIARAHALGLDASTTAHEMFLYRSYAENLRKYAEQEGFQQRQREWVRECERIKKEQREAHQQIGTQAQQSAAQAAAAQAAAAGSAHGGSGAAASSQSQSASQSLPGPHTLREDSLLFPPAPVLSTRQKRQPLVLLSDIPQFDVASKLNTGPVPEKLFEITSKAPPAPTLGAAHKDRRKKQHSASALLAPVSSTEPDYSSPAFLLSSLRSRISQSFVALFLGIHASHKDFFYLHYYDCLAQLLFYTLLVAYPDTRALVNHAFFKKRLLQLLAFWILGFVPSDLERNLDRWRGDIQFITGVRGINRDWEKEHQAWNKEQAARANGGTATPQQNQQQQQLQPGSEEFEAQLAETLGAASIASAAAAAASSSASSSPRGSDHDGSSRGGDSSRDQRNKRSAALASTAGLDASTPPSPALASASAAGGNNSSNSGGTATGSGVAQGGGGSVLSSHYVSQLERKLNLHLAASVKSQRQAKAAAAAAAAAGSPSHHHHHQLLLAGAGGMSQHMLAHTSMASIIAAQEKAAAQAAAAAAAAAAATVIPSPTSADAVAAAAAASGAAAPSGPGTVPSSPGKLPPAAHTQAQSASSAAQNQRPKGQGFDAATGAAQSSIGHLRSITHELTGDLLVDVGERLASGAQDRVPLRVSRRKVTLHHSALVQDFLEARHFSAQSNHALRIPISVPVVGAEAAAAGSMDQLARFNEARRQESLALRAKLNQSRVDFARQSVRSKKDLSEIARRFSAEKERALREAGAFSKTLVADYEEKKYHELKAPAKSLALRRLGHFRQTKEDATNNSAAHAPANKSELSSTLIKATLMM